MSCCFTATQLRHSRDEKIEQAYQLYDVWCDNLSVIALMFVPSAASNMVI